MARSFIARCAWSAAIAAGVVLLGAVPASAQQLVDAGQEGDGSGGLAFVLFALMVFLMGASMFFMDKVRRRASDAEDPNAPKA
jgi:hypothetical protein